MPLSYDDATVAPRVGMYIKYRAATGDTSGEVELALSLLVIGNLHGNADEVPLEHRPCISINQQNFNAVMKEANLQLAFNIAHPHASGGNREVSRIARQVPELNRLLQLREALVALKGPLGNMPAFRQRLEALLHNPEARHHLLHELSLLTPDD